MVRATFPEAIIGIAKKKMISRMNPTFKAINVRRLSQPSKNAFFIKKPVIYIYTFIYFRRFQKSKIFKTPSFY